jgi:RNA polymerase sigma factor (sigma-70 family)
VNADRDLFRRAQSGDVAARNAIVTANLGLVHAVARRYAAHHPGELDDLTQAGALGLARAVERFDPERGVRFSTYAGLWVRASCTRYLAAQGDVSAGRVGRPSVQRRLDAVPDGEHEHRDRLRRQLVAMAPALRLDAPLGDAEGSTHLDMVPDAGPLPDELAAQRARVAVAHRAIEVLDERSARIMRRRLEGATLAAVGRELGVSRERVRQIEALALPVLRERCAPRTL